MTLSSFSGLCLLMPAAPIPVPDLEPTDLYTVERVVYRGSFIAFVVRIERDSVLVCRVVCQVLLAFRWELKVTLCTYFQWSLTLVLCFV